MKLTAEQCYTISSYLNSAATLFEDFRKQCESTKDASIKRTVFTQLIDQWELQKHQAQEFAVLFGNAKEAEVIEESWTQDNTEF